MLEHKSMSLSICLVQWIHCHVARNPELLSSVLVFFTDIDKKTIPSMELRDLCLSTEFKTSLFINYNASVEDHEEYLFSIKVRNFLSADF